MKRKHVRPINRVMPDNHVMTTFEYFRTMPVGLVGAQLRKLVMLRWLSVAGMLLSTFALPPLLELSVLLGPLVSIALAMAAANMFTLAWLARSHMPAPSAVLLQLLLDLAGWSAFIYFAGGATNPLISLLLCLVAIGAVVLPILQAWLLAVLAVVAYTLLWRYSHPIQLQDEAMAAQWHLLGMWFTFAVSAGVIAGFVAHMTAALRERDRALADAREARARDERIVALGNLAAGAAHNLGTPLGTMRILVDELLQTTGLSVAIYDDLQLMSEQIEHCKQTLGVLTARAGNLRAEGGGEVVVSVWLDEILKNWQMQRPHACLRRVQNPELDKVAIVADATLGQALHTLVNNAADVSADDIEVAAVVVAGALRIEVRDRGPGIADEIRATLGHAPLDDRPAGMGIGLFLARAALARHKGQLDFSMRSGGGTTACMQLPLEMIEK